MVADACEVKIAGALKAKIDASELNLSAIDLNMGAAKKIINLMDADAPT